MSSLSATELSRLHRQRRLESSSPIHKVTPTNIKRRSRRSSNSISNDEAGNNLVTEGASYSFDEEVSAANSNAVKAKDGGSSNADASRDRNVATPTRSFSFSSFSVPFTAEDSEAMMMSPATPATPSHVAPTIAAVTPPDSPGHRSMSAAYSLRSAASPRCPSPTPSLGAFLDGRSTRGTPVRPSLNRSSSSRSMPCSPQSAKTRSPSRPNSILALKNSHQHTSTTGALDPDMPLDELMAVSTRGVPGNSRLPPSRRHSLETAAFVAAPSNSTDTNSNSSDNMLPLIPSNGGGSTNQALVVPATPPPLMQDASIVLHRMSQALQRQDRPAHMTVEEQQLWNVVQTLLDKKSGSSTKKFSTKGSNYWEQKYQQREVEWKEQQKEHDRALRAIQRVLADVTTEREQTVAKLQQHLELSLQQRDDTILKLTHKLKEMQQEMSTQNERPLTNSTTSDDEDKYASEVADLKRQLEELREHNVRLQKESQLVETKDSQETYDSLLELQRDDEKKAKQIQELQEQVESLKSSGLNSSTSSDKDKDDLRQELKEKTASLENAKMIIASLESANGSLARELRAKLKEKEEELATLTSTSADRKRTLDSLATELRELQRQQQKPRLSQKQLAHQRALCQLLDKNVKALRQAAVQHEAQNDQSSVDQISQIVSETFTSLKHNLESWETYLKSTDVCEQPQDVTGSDAQLEAVLTKKNDEVKAVRQELERVKTESSQQIAQLQHEVQSLKEQLATNMEILAKKGRELSVLRDSLNVDDDNGVGYISDDDDGTDGEDPESDPVATSADFRVGPQDTSAFTGKLLVHGGAGVGSVNPNAAEMSDATAAEIQMLKNEIIKQQKEREAKTAELQAEKESLANAKMIISSLEKANKSMLEDLRSRLQDSNTAIASLLEKSMDHEKTIAMLRKELETVRQEREKEEQKATAQIAKLREENLVFSMRLAAKDREVDDLQTSLAQYEGQEVTISKVRMSSVEEKKDDPASDEDE